MFLLSLPMCFRCYGNLKFPKTYNGKVEIDIYFCVTADILTESKFMIYYFGTIITDRYIKKINLR